METIIYLILAFIIIYSFVEFLRRETKKFHISPKRLKNSQTQQNAQSPYVESLKSRNEGIPFSFKQTNTPQIRESPPSPYIPKPIPPRQTYNYSITERERFKALLRDNLSQNCDGEISTKYAKTPIIPSLQIKNIMENSPSSPPELNHENRFEEQEKIKALYKECYERIAKRNGEIKEDLDQGENAIGRKNRRVPPSKVRNDVWVRDRGKCRICGSQENLHFDHIIPFSKGGGYTVKNIQILCSKCNLKKSDRIQ